MMFRFFLVFLVSILFGQIAYAETLFSDDFQTGTTGEWKGNPGKGDIRLTSYKNNISLRLQHDAYAVHLVPTGNYSHINVSVSLAADGLKSKNYCILETSFGEDKWQEIGRIGDGQDDGLSLYKISGATPEASGHKLLAVRLRINAHKDSATCWADNVVVIGKVDHKSLAKAVPFERFFSNSPLAKPFSTSAFTQPSTVQPLKRKIVGNLSLKTSKLADGFAILKDDFGYETATGQLQKLPSFSLDIVSSGDVLIPVQRGPQRSDHPDWEWIFEPGKIWNNQGDAGWSRASMPIALQERNANCIHNGLMSFLYKDGKVSNAVVQIGSETCAYLQFDMWSRLEVVFEPKNIKNPEDVIRNYQSELKNRLPRRPLRALEGVDISQIGSSQEISPENMTAYGFVKENILYASTCKTRFGDYSYCAAMPLPSYSMAKSMVAGIGLMRLEKLYPGARNAKIADYVPECSAKKWGAVTFENALDMSTGNYSSAVYDQDEAAPKTWAFMNEETHQEKIKRACKVHKRKAKLGKKFVYHTTDTYILGAAMQAYLREKSADANADIYDDLIGPIWQALHLSPLAQTTRRTRDSEAQPFTGWGLTLHADDIVRIGLFLQSDGKIAGQALLDADLLNAALQGKNDDRGHKAINESLRYRAGFWAYNAGPFMGCKGDMWIPNMSGFGGLATVLMPNGHVYFYISDGHEYAWRRAAKASNTIQPFCEMK